MKPIIAGVAALIICVAGRAGAADTGQLPCATTAECNQQALKIGASTGSSGEMSTGKIDRDEDQFYWLNKINRASAVMLVEDKIIPRELGHKLATGVDFAIAHAAQAGGKRPSDVLQIEKIIADHIGPDASFIHTGRSRQDMYATYRMAKLRNQVLDFSDALNAMRARVLAIAAKNVDTIVPAYTNGVQAQPTSYAHYLLGYAASFARDAQRIHDLYRRLDLCAMGTAVLANSSWPLNRKRMADLLDFEGVIENSLDAGQISPSDISLEAASIVESNAIRLGAVLDDIHTQYHQTRPWLLLEEGTTYTSSAMPQKRNPGVIMRSREEASNVVGIAQGVVIRAHNVTTGMTDYKAPWAELGLFAHAVRMVSEFDVVLDALKINPQRSLEELEDDWTTSMELAETLQREHQIPFRVGHSFASSVVEAARADGLKPKTFPYSKAIELYAAAIQKVGLTDTKLPLDETEFRRVLSPELMVKTRVGVGGPQPAEVERQLAAARATLDVDIKWMETARENVATADARLDAAFRQLLSP